MLCFGFFNERRAERFCRNVWLVGKKRTGDRRGAMRRETVTARYLPSGQRDRVVMYKWYEQSTERETDWMAGTGGDVDCRRWQSDCDGLREERSIVAKVRGQVRVAEASDIVLA